MDLDFNSKDFLKTLTSQPGVYQMMNATGDVLYVGKAKDLKKRVSSYFRTTAQSNRINSLVKQIARVEVIITPSENEAFLLENNLIKQFKPKYNVLFRDDKSYPYIFLSAHADFPRLDFHRGPKRQKGNYYGPYPSAGSVRESLGLLQKLFRIRQCTDTFFSNRTRPCIQYQIKRCTAPCVNYIDPEHYLQNVSAAKLFLEGKNQELLNDLIQKMEVASTNLKYEEALRYRDQIALLRKVQEKQYVMSSGEGDVDIIALLTNLGVACVNILFIRRGRMIGSHAYFPKTPGDLTPEEIMSEFLPQYYLSSNHEADVPKEILVNVLPTEQDWLTAGLSKAAGRKVHISRPIRGERLGWLTMSIQNANNALTTHVTDKLNYFKRLEALQEVFNLDNLPQRIECFDISHTFGESPVGSCVVFNQEGPQKNAYRRFNIEGITPGDDYAALTQTLMRRYTRIKKENAPQPDIIIIDGGKGQLHQGEMVLEELQLTGILLMSIAKGPERKAGMETIFVCGREEAIELAPDSLAFHLLQQIRDEAHRFAITGHKGRRSKTRFTSALQSIPGIGPKRRQQILQHFGGLQAVRTASIEELTKIPGISKQLAQEIYESLHGK